MHMSMMYGKRCYLAKPIVAGLEVIVSGSRMNLNCLLPVCSCHCVSGLIPRRQSCSASMLVCKGKCLEAAERPLVVGPRVPDRTPVDPTVIP